MYVCVCVCVCVYYNRAHLLSNNVHVPYVVSQHLSLSRSLSVPRTPPPTHTRGEVKQCELFFDILVVLQIEDLRANTEYTGYTRDSPQISWFWTVVQSMVQEDLARLLQFVTGTSQVPMEGFKALRGMNGPQV